MKHRSGLRDTLQYLRRDLIDCLRELQAIETLANTITPGRIEELQEMRRRATDCKSRHQLRGKLHCFEQQLQRLRERKKVCASREDLLRFLERAEGVAPGIVVYISKPLLSEWLPQYKGAHESPAHCRIAVDPNGRLPRWPRFETQLLEASLFEDMAALFNQAKNYREQLESAGAKKLIKITYALYRAVISAAFYFVEGYLNGLAAEYLTTTKGNIDPATRDLLTEWDSKRQKPKFISTRDKLLQYPRAATGTQYPPLQENNCPEMRLFNDKAKLFRDSIVHASPILKPSTPEFDKELAFYHITFADVQEVVDGSIRLVMKIQEKVHGRGRPLGWLHERGSDGAFSDEVFA